VCTSTIGRCQLCIDSGISIFCSQTNSTGLIQSKEKGTSPDNQHRPRNKTPRNKRLNQQRDSVHLRRWRSGADMYDLECFHAHWDLLDSKFQASTARKGKADSSKTTLVGLNTNTCIGTDWPSSVSVKLSIWVRDAHRFQRIICYR